MKKNDIVPSEYIEDGLGQYDPASGEVKWVSPYVNIATVINDNGDTLEEILPTSYKEIQDEINRVEALYPTRLTKVEGDLVAHKEDYANQRQQDQLKVATVEKGLSDYKSTLANVNVNQEAKQKVTGYGTISLPKNTANGQANISLKGNTVTDETGTKSTISASRLKSVGKNLFDYNSAPIYKSENMPKLNYRQFAFYKTHPTATDDFSHNEGVYEYVARDNGRQGYRLVYRGVPNTTYNVYFYGDNDNSSYLPPGWNTRIIETNAEGIGETILFTARYSTSRVVFSRVMVTKLPIQNLDSSYEPYKESTQYLPNVGELRSVGIVKDEIIKVDGVWKHIKRIDNDGVTILATPIITPIQVSGNLISYPSGTVYVENVVADAGTYTTKFDIKELQLPIKSIDKLIKYNFTTGVQTVLDASLAVINEDKKSFTHPNLAKDDMVFVDYYYDVEGTLGETTIEYLDSRHTIKDTTNNKFYKWNIKSTNGVPTVALTEV